jgi:hemin uptake protein HemP
MSLQSQSDFSAASHVTSPLPIHAARDLTRGGTQARIELDGKVYDLRITRAGKLILTK